MDLFLGDIGRMDHRSNDDVLHAVYPARDNNNNNNDDDGLPANGRIGLVLKRAIC
jgi:hypothetical protein